MIMRIKGCSSKSLEYKYCNKRAQHKNKKKEFKKFHFIYSFLTFWVYCEIGLINTTLSNMIKTIGTGIFFLNINFTVFYRLF